MQELFMKHFFIINPHSFRGNFFMETVIANIRTVFQTRQEEYVIHVSRFPRDAIAVIRNYVKDIPPGETVRVYAVGGDGILFDCLNGVVGLVNAELAIVPYGHTNDMVRAFGENKNELFRNIALQAASSAIPTDIIHCGSVYALNFCTIGVESNANMKSLELNKYLENRKGIFLWINDVLYQFLYYLGGFMAAFDKPVLNQQYTLTIDGKGHTGRYCSINIANGPCYAGDKSPVITAVPDDGFLDALFFKSAPPLKILSKMIPYTKGRYTEFVNDLQWKRVRQMTIRSTSPLYLNLDGELFFDTNMTVEVVPGAVKIVAVNGLKYERRAEPDERFL
jgi:diacylglycerol kinase family enzyme